MNTSLILNLLRTLLTCIFCLLLAPYSAASQALQTLLQDVQKSQFVDSYEIILAGEQEVPLLISDSNTPITRGVAVILGEAGKAPLFNSGITQLINGMNDVGWVTILMPAPDAGFSQALEDEKASPSVNSPGDAQTAPTPLVAQSGLTRIYPKAFEQQEQLLKLQMQAVAQKSQQYSGFFLVVAHGTSAAWLTKIYSEKQLPIPDALVAVSPYWPQRDYNNQLAQWVGQTEMPYLDIYNQWDSEWARNTVKQRRVAAVKSLKLIYRQRELVGQTMDAEQYAMLAKEIYGWLTYMGW